MPTPMPKRNILLITLVLSLLVSCTRQSIEQLPSHNYGERIKFIVMHFTALNYEDSVRALVDEGGLSSHYLVPERFDPTYPDDELKVKQLVKESERAWHAGRSYWQGRKNVNDQSIGIEIVNVPECHYDPLSKAASRRENDNQRLCLFPDYDPEQIQLLIKLTKAILARHPDIGPTQVVGHSDIAPNRKNDPGPRFPWYQLYKAGVGAWYENHTVKHYWQQFNQNMPSLALLQRALKRYGYGLEVTGQLDGMTIDTLSAFQMHFLPWQVTGNADSRTAATLFALLERYFPKRAEKLMEAYQNEVENQPTNTVFRPKNGQIEQQFPDPDPSSRQWVNDRTRFKSYRGRGKIIIDNHDAKQADIIVNGQRLNIANPMRPHQAYNYSLSKRSKNGSNMLRVNNVIPEDSQLKITIPYPVLIDKTQQEQQAFAAVDKLIEQEIKQGFPGAVLLVVKDGAIVKRSAYGYARKYADGGEPLSKPIKMRTNTLFDLASNTKMFATNLALMKLVSEDRLDVNRPLHVYLPEYQGQGRETRTVRDLLTHTAGYAPEVHFFNSDNKLGKRFYSQNKAKTERLLLTKVPFVSERGQAAIYSDTDYMLLGILVERITGLPLDTYLEANIYHPLKLQNTRFNPTLKGVQASRCAATEIHGNSRGQRINFDNIRQQVLQCEVHDEKAFYSMQGVAGHAGLFSTVDDLAILAQMLLNGGGYDQVEMIAPGVIDSFIKPEEGNATYGLGWRRAGHSERIWHFGPYASPRAYGHTGWTGTVTVIDPEHDLAIILLTNARHSPIEEDPQGKLAFVGKNFEVGRYGSVISLVYEALLEQ